jgi:hypothetical protein
MYQVAAPRPGAAGEANQLQHGHWRGLTTAASHFFVGLVDMEPRPIQGT